MAELIEKAGLLIAAPLARFIEQQALPGTGLEAGPLWDGIAAIYARFAPDNRALLATRDALQAKIDAWHVAHADALIDSAAYQACLREIGYLVAEPAPFAVGSADVDDEVARTAGPQLVVPVLNARFVLNAANARWGSLYDALYGTDAIPGAAAGKGYDAARGVQVIAGATVRSTPRSTSTGPYRWPADRGPLLPAAIRCLPIPPNSSAAPATTCCSVTTACTSRS